MGQARIIDRGVSCRSTQGVATFRTAVCSEIVFLGAVSLLLAAAPIEAGPDDDDAYARFRVIAEKNMFARRQGAAEQGEEPADTSPAAPFVKIKLVGIVRRSNPLSSIAIIEEGGQHHLYRVGDRIGTLILRSIRDHDIVFETPHGLWLAEIEPSATQQRDAPSQRRPPRNGFVRGPDRAVPSRHGRLPLRVVEVKKLAQAGLTPYAENGTVKGLELTRDIMGLQQGDRVTHVSGQALRTRRPRQKLWQIVRKHSISGTPSPGIPVVIERNQQEIEFVISLAG